MMLHDILDIDYGPDGDEKLRRLLDEGTDPNQGMGPLAETPLHVAARRRRCSAVAFLLDHGADIDAQNATLKTAFAHAVRRGVMPTCKDYSTMPVFAYAKRWSY